MLRPHSDLHRSVLDRALGYVESCARYQTPEVQQRLLDALRPWIKGIEERGEAHIADFDAMFPHLNPVLAELKDETFGVTA
jgi:hypothetical protein